MPLVFDLHIVVKTKLNTNILLLQYFNIYFFKTLTKNVINNLQDFVNMWKINMHRIWLEYSDFMNLNYDL